MTAYHTENVRTEFLKVSDQEVIQLEIHVLQPGDRYTPPVWSLGKIQLQEILSLVQDPAIARVHHYYLNTKRSRWGKAQPQQDVSHIYKPQTLTGTNLRLAYSFKNKYSNHICLMPGRKGYGSVKVFPQKLVIHAHPLKSLYQQGLMIEKGESRYFSNSANDEVPKIGNILSKKSARSPPYSEKYASIESSRDAALSDHAELDTSTVLTAEISVESPAIRLPSVSSMDKPRCKIDGEKTAESTVLFADIPSDLNSLSGLSLSSAFRNETTTRFDKDGETEKKDTDVPHTQDIIKEILSMGEEGNVLEKDQKSMTETVAGNVDSRKAVDLNKDVEGGEIVDRKESGDSEDKEVEREENMDVPIDSYLVLSQGSNFNCDLEEKEEHKAGHDIATKKRKLDNSTEKHEDVFKNKLRSPELRKGRKLSKKKSPIDDFYCLKPAGKKIKTRAGRKKSKGEGPTLMDISLSSSDEEIMSLTKSFVNKSVQEAPLKVQTSQIIIAGTNVLQKSDSLRNLRSCRNTSQLTSAAKVSSPSIQSGCRESDDKRKSSEDRPDSDEDEDDSCGASVQSPSFPCDSNSTATTSAATTSAASSSSIAEVAAFASPDAVPKPEQLKVRLRRTPPPQEWEIVTVSSSDEEGDSRDSVLPACSFLNKPAPARNENDNSKSGEEETKRDKPTNPKLNKNRSGKEAQESRTTSVSEQKVENLHKFVLRRGASFKSIETKNQGSVGLSTETGQAGVSNTEEDTMDVREEDIEDIFRASCVQASLEELHRGRISMDDIMKHSSPSTLSDEQIHFLMSSNMRTLKRIFRGEQVCERHADYKKGGKAKLGLAYQIPLGEFSDEQVDFVMETLIAVFCKSHFKVRTWLG